MKGMNRNSRNSELLQMDDQHLIHPMHHQTGHSSARVWVKGKDSYLFDADGKRYIDGLSSVWNVSAGHAREELAVAAFKQMNELAFATNYSGGSNRPAIELAERMAAICYPSINNFYFTSGGGESTDSNIKLARHYWKVMGKPEKSKVISCLWGYHGSTFAATCANGISAYWPSIEPLIPGFSHIPYPDPYRYQLTEGAESLGIAAANELEKEILEQGAETVAMFIVEPVQGAAGVIVPPDDYFARIREICDQYEVLLVADEVITGFGRTGKMFGLEHSGIQPDLMQVAKAFTSGAAPLGAIGMSDTIAETIRSSNKPWMHAYTYSGHPTMCAVALANLDLVEKEDLVGLAATNGETMLQLYRDALENHPHVGVVRGKGMMHGIEIVKDKSTGEVFEPELQMGARLIQAMLEKGLYTRVRGEVICSAPPLNTAPDILSEMVEIVHESIVEVVGT